MSTTPKTSFFSLPYELRLEIYSYLVGDPVVSSCQRLSLVDSQASKHGACTALQPGQWREGFNLYSICDNRLLRVNRQVYGEFREVVRRRPRTFVACNGPCLERMFLSVKPRDRRWIRQVQVRLYVGPVPAEGMESLRKDSLLKKGEERSGHFVQNALKCLGVGEVVDAAVLGPIEMDERKKWTVWVEVTLGD